MAYSNQKFQLTHLLQDLWFRLGQMRTWLVTGGTASTVINTAWAGVEDAIYEDDDPSLIYGTVVVVKNASDSGLAPEGEFGEITDYDSSAQTITMKALTQAVANLDTVGIASPLFPLQDMVRAANIALQKLGYIDIPDTSISIVAGQTEYTLPAAIRTMPIRVRYQTIPDSNNNQWHKLNGFEVIPATAGQNWTLVIPQLSVGTVLEVVYRGLHPKLAAYDSDIIETVHPELAICATIAEAYQWYNNQVGGSNQYMLQRENKAIQDLEAAKILHPIDHVVEQLPGFPHWSNSNRYVPLTSDLRE